MLSVYKYPFKFDSKISLRMVKGAKILKFDVQDHTPTVWALVNAEARGGEDRNFILLGTGHTTDIDEFHLSFIDSVLTHEGKFVWHLFEVL